MYPDNEYVQAETRKCEQPVWDIYVLELKFEYGSINFENS